MICTPRQMLLGPLNKKVEVGRAFGMYGEDGEACMDFFFRGNPKDPRMYGRII